MDVFVAAFRGRLEEGKDLVSLWRVGVEPATLSDHWRVTEASREVCVACVEGRLSQRHRRCHRAEIISYLDGRQEKSSLSYRKNQRIKESAEICRGSTSTPQCSSLGPLLENDYPAGLRTFKSHKANNNR